MAGLTDAKASRLPNCISLIQTKIATTLQCGYDKLFAMLAFGGIIA
jgi:hypothetical protein